MDEFLAQFIAQAWRGVALVLVFFGLALFFAWRTRNRREQEKRERKKAINPDSASSAAEKSKQRQKRAPVAALDDLFAEEDDLLFEEPIIRAEGSIFDDEELFADEVSPTVSAAVGQPPEDEESVALASLLAGMAEEPKNYHLISDTPVGVRLVTGNKAVATELISILRDERDKRLMVQIGDVGYRTLRDDKGARTDFTNLMKELSGLILNPDESPPDDADVTGIRPNLMSTEPVDVPVASGGETSAREMLSILRDDADGRLIIQIGNTGYRTLVGHEKAKAGFSRVMKELSTSVTQVDDNPPPAAAPSPPESSLIPLTTSGDIFDEQPEKPLPGDIRIARMDELPDTYEVGRFGRVKVKKVENKVEEVNIAEAIEAYLQHKIRQTPQFQNRGIHIRSAAGGGVRIEVEGATYEFVDEIEQEDARKFIQETIAEWQERH